VKVDLFRCESILLRSHWVMVVMDVLTRRIIGFGVERTDLCGVSVCRMFNQIIAGKSLPRHLSSDTVAVTQNGCEGFRDRGRGWNRGGAEITSSR
jgi:hypothetical protein